LVPFGAAEVREGEVGFFLGHQVGVGSERELWVLMPELIGNPSEALAGSEGGARVGVASAGGLFSVHRMGFDRRTIGKRRCASEQPD
jgi:hypothetical protein